MRDQSRLHSLLETLASIAIGFVVSFFSGLIVVKTMLDFINRYGLAPYGWWRIGVGLIGLGVVFLG